jgi:hypothetical protein
MVDYFLFIFYDAFLPSLTFTSRYYFMTIILNVDKEVEILVIHGQQ